jgi:multiple sugar transport system substrate-binding protein
MRKMHTVLLPVAIASALILAGCAGSGSDASNSSAPVTSITSNVEITFWHGMTGEQGKTLTTLTDEFMKANPKIKVNLQNQSSYADLQQKLTSTLQSPKNLPTITQAYPSWLTQAFGDDQVVDLNPYINSKDSKLAFDGWTSDVLPGLRDGVTFDGKTLGMPFNKSTEVLWYNKTMLDSLGIKPPTSYDELAAAAKQIRQAKGIPGFGADSLSNFYITYVKNEGKTFDKNLDVTGSQSSKAFAYYGSGINDGSFRIAGTDKYMSGPFGSQKAAMYIGSIAGESFVKQGAQGKFEYSAAPYPAKYALQQGTDIYMFTSATPEQRTAAYLYEKFLTTKDSQITWALGTGYMPIRKSAIADPKYSGSDSAIAPILADATKNVFTPPITDGYQQAMDDTEKALESFLAKPNNDVKNALSSFKETYDSDWNQ